jgi:hypothetical protein
VVLEKRLRDIPGGAPYALGTSSAVTTTASSVVVVCARIELWTAENSKPAHTISGMRWRS